MNDRWMQQALCREVDTGDVFFPEKGGESRTPKRICGMCPVQAACLDYALSCDDGLFGVWGGTTEHERRDLRRRRAS